jgi:hypothetical protein
MLRISVFLLTVFLFASCEKSPNPSDTIIDPPVIDLNGYCGDFSFTTIYYFWMMNQPSKTDTIYRNGTVRIYAEGDDAYDYAEQGFTADNTMRLTIDFGQSRYFCPEVDDSSKFVHAYGYHYSHNGQFTGYDTLSFYIGGLGGLGGGTSYTVSGVRKPKILVN